MNKSEDIDELTKKVSNARTVKSLIDIENAAIGAEKGIVRANRLEPVCGIA